VDLCRECAGNRWLRKIELAAGLEGGRPLVFLEFAAPVDHPVVKQFAGQWQARADDPEFQEVSRQRGGSMPNTGDRRPGGAGATWTTPISSDAYDPG
jgi:hypothetical protein